MTRTSRHFCLRVGTLAIGALVHSVTYAADGQVSAPIAAPAASDDPATEVVITGSRVIQDGTKAPTPITVLGASQLLTGAPTSIADGLAQVPQFRSTTRPGTFITPQSSTGAFLSLRGLGGNRTLTLLDGRRTPPTTSDGRTDINVFPQLLLKRVDVVTGGASAAYGSDAVAGVVNFVTDTTFQGVKGEFGGGISDRNDDRSRKASIAVGTPFADGRGHLVASVEYAHTDGILTSDKRGWDNKGWDIIPNPNYPKDGRPANLLVSGVTGAQLAEGGVITAGPLKGTQFLAGGVPAPFAYGSDVSASTMVGGDGAFSKRGNIDTPIKTLATFAHATFDATPDFNIFLEGAYSKTRSFFGGTMPNFSASTGFTIFSDNAYLPAAIKARMANANVASIPLGRLSTDWGRTDASSDTRTYRGAAGFDWRLGGGWNVDGSVDTGITKVRLQSYHTVNQISLFNAADSVISPVTGQPVCRSTLTNPGNGCVPIDLFGPGAASQQALDYILDDGWSDTRIRQTAGHLSLRGEPFRLWAGPVSFGTGVDFRRVSAVQESDPLSQTVIQAAPGSKGLPPSLAGKLGAFLTGNQSRQPFQAVTVKEAYAEVLVPLVHGGRFAEALDANAAIRYADYSSSGGVWSWKLGLNYQPFEAVRFRSTYSRDVRAPTLNELYSPLRVSLGALRDPVTGANNSTVQYFGGNPDLRPEIAKTFTGGVVAIPPFLPGLNASIDYYQIRLKGAIGTLGGLNVLNLCAGGQTGYCQYVQRLPDKTLVSVTLQNLNLNQLKNDGVDFELNYRRGLADISDSLGGDLSLRLLVSYLAHYKATDPFGTVVDSAGVNGGEGDGTPHWQGSFAATYAIKGFSIFAQERYVGSGIYSTNYVEGGTAANSINNNHIPRIWYTDLTLKYRFKKVGCDCELYLGVNNLFDQDPPVAPSRIGAPVSIIATNPTLYDTVGRYYTAGLRYRF